MSDAISRSAVLEEVYEMDISGCKEPDDVVHLAYAKIAHAPALDVAPVVHARWIEDGYRGIPCVCSHCGEEAHYTSTFQEKFDYDWDENLVSCGYEEIREHIRSKCCPECGARMDAESEEETDELL